MNAITEAVRKRKRTWPSVPTRRNASTSQHRQAHELNPSRNLDRVAGGGHRADRIAAVCASSRGSARLRGMSRRTSSLAYELATVMEMTTPRSRHAARLRANRRRAQARARWFAVAMVVGVVAVATLLLTAFDNRAVPSSAGAPVPAPLPVTSAPPEPQVLATVGNLRVQSPVAQGGVTAVGFHGSDEGALELHPVGPQANEGLARAPLAQDHGLLPGGSHLVSARRRSASNAGRRSGRRDRRLFARRRDGDRDPRTGRIGPQDRRRDRAQADSSAPSLVVSLQNVRPDTGLTVGANVAAGSSKLGRVADISRLERQALERFAADGGNNVAIQVYLVGDARRSVAV